MCTYNRKAHHKMSSMSQLKEILRRADAVCFDVDSTVIKEEGIDELAKFCGVGDAVAEMTRKAMGGSLTFKAALTERLTLIRPSREQVQALITEHPPRLTEGIKFAMRPGPSVTSWSHDRDVTEGHGRTASLEPDRRLQRPGDRDVRGLHQRSVQVFLISGGFQSIVEHVAAELDIPLTSVYANRLKFYFNGRRHTQRMKIQSVYYGRNTLKSPENSGP
ncbi:unnamed protein product [Ranitomeya imitator]|uniref:Phosphoserine phosphatase n=1 Tax=Ranitomeya imitator TaxID=111125 RepID=A0ABN9LX55_9NEOB|nr:unnamed protein product [Ranitomeya imitator]